MLRTLLKIVGIACISILALIAILILSPPLLGTRSNIAAGVTGDKIKQVKPGMSMEEVVSILGNPYGLESMAGLHTFQCQHPKPSLQIAVTKSLDIRKAVDDFYNDTIYCCPGNREDKQTKEITLIYTKPVEFSMHYPMLWIHLDSSFRVYGVYAKRYDGFLGLDDPCIYSQYWERMFDSIGTVTFTGNIDYFIDEPKFAECFH